MNEHPKTQWDCSGVYCPACSAWLSDFKWHEGCRNLKKPHLHIKCNRCSYTWATGPRHADV